MQPQLKHPERAQDQKKQHFVRLSIPIPLFQFYYKKLVDVKQEEKKASDKASKGSGKGVNRVGLGR